MTTPPPLQYWLIDKAGIEWLEQLAAQSNFANGITLSKIIDDVRSHPYNIATERTEFLGRIALRIRQEFTQDDDEEWYLCADDFENVLDEFIQEFEDEELRTSKEEM